jgi:hypothetical protein
VRRRVVYGHLRGHGYAAGSKCGIPPDRGGHLDPVTLAVECSAFEESRREQTMCGRITRTSPRFGVTRFAEVDWHPRYNVAPSQIVETSISVDGEKHWDRCAGASSRLVLQPVMTRERRGRLLEDASVAEGPTVARCRGEPGNPCAACLRSPLQSETRAYLNLVAGKAGPRKR